jgi:hypothetical protein
MLNLVQADGNDEQELWEDCLFQGYCKYEIGSAIKKWRAKVHPW